MLEMQETDSTNQNYMMNKIKKGYHSPEIEWWSVSIEAGFAASEGEWELSPEELQEIEEIESEW